MLKGYAVNEKRLKSLNRTVEIWPRIVISALEFEREDGFKVITEYTMALIFFDDNDNQCLTRPEGNDTLYRLS